MYMSIYLHIYLSLSTQLPKLDINCSFSLMKENGELVITCQEERTQYKNKVECIKKLKVILIQAAVKPKERKQRVGISNYTKQKRKESKRLRSSIKNIRRGGYDD